jgi:lysophospholipase L1-like esterase
MRDGSIGRRFYRRPPVQLPLFQAAINRSRAGGAPAKIACLGDSTVAGGQGDATNGANLANSWPLQVGQSLATALGLSFSAKSMWGRNNYTSITYPTYNTETDFGSSGWTSEGNFGLGGYYWLNSSTTDHLTYSPSTPVDTIDVYYYRNPGQVASVSISVDGGTADVVSTSGTAALLKRTYSLTLGVHTIAIWRTSGSLRFAGFEAYDSTARLRVANMGASGSATSEWVSQPVSFGPLMALPVYAPDLTTIALGLNDLTGWDQSVWSSRINSLIDAAKLSGDVIIVSQQLRSGTTVQQQVHSTILDIGKARRIPVIDLSALFVNYGTANANGYMLDSLHLNLSGEVVARAEELRVIQQYVS